MDLSVTLEGDGCGLFVETPLDYPESFCPDGEPRRFRNVGEIINHTIKPTGFRNGDISCKVFGSENSSYYRRYRSASKRVIFFAASNRVVGKRRHLRDSDGSSKL